MATNRKIRVGIVGANPSRGFASIAHIPALQELADFEISAVCTTRQDSAEAAAEHYGVPLAFCDAEKLAQHPDVDLVTVSVKVPDHYLAMSAASLGTYYRPRLPGRFRKRRQSYDDHRRSPDRRAMLLSRRVSRA